MRVEHSRFLVLGLGTGGSLGKIPKCGHVDDI